MIAALALTACAADPRVARNASAESIAERACEAALQHYAALLREADPGAVARLFTPTGKLERAGQAPVVGRGQIEQALRSSAGFRVLAHDIRLMRSAPAPSHVSQSGTYVQTVRDPQGQELVVRGWFVLQWERQADGIWLVEYARMSSAAAPDAAAVPAPAGR